jgi:hypothetical protein
MSRTDLTSRSQQVLAWLAAQVSIANGAGFSDISVVSETSMQNVFNLIEEGAAYVNTNLDAPNTDSIDLADSGRRIAVQVTSNTTAEKIQKTIDGFEKNKRQEQYDRLRFLFLSDRYHPTKSKYSLSGVEIEFEDLGQLHARIVRIEDVDQLRRVVELLENELAPWVSAGKAKVTLVKEKLTISAESIRLECRVNNVGELTATNVQMSVWASIPGQLDVIPKAGWYPIPGIGTPGTRTFQSEQAIHPKDSIRAIISLAPRQQQNSLAPTFRIRLSAPDVRPQFFEMTTAA